MNSISSDLIRKQYYHINNRIINFSDCITREFILEYLKMNNFLYMSDIQKACLGHGILGLDLICQAKSGMGKTFIYLLTIIEKVPLETSLTHALVICPTRELAEQVHDQTRLLINNQITTFCSISGISIELQKSQLRKSTPNIIVGTIGRTLNLMSLKFIDVSKIRFFVIDECDKILGERKSRSEIQKIIIHTPLNKQTLLFSATIPDNIKVVCRKLTVDALEIYIDDECKLTLDGLTQYFIRVNEKNKTKELINILKKSRYNQVIIFVNTKIRARGLNEILNNFDFSSIYLHASMRPRARFKTIDLFRSKERRILITTNLISRGIDIEQVDFVINYDFPEKRTKVGESESDIYIHRIGRAGRFGTYGMAISFISNPKQMKCLNKIQEQFSSKIMKLERI